MSRENQTNQVILRNRMLTWTFLLSLISCQSLEIVFWKCLEIKRKTHLLQGEKKQHFSGLHCSAIKVEMFPVSNRSAVAVRFTLFRTRLPLHGRLCFSKGQFERFLSLALSFK